MSKLSLKEIEDRFKATLLGVAIGDALGNPVEGLSHGDIKNKYGEITDYIERWDPKGSITDDTELTLCVAESLVNFGAFSLEDIAQRFISWLPKANSFGSATQTAIINLATGIHPTKSGVYSAGNGAAMKVAPLGLLYSHPADSDLLFSTVNDLTKITHTDDRAFAGAFAVAYALQYILNLKTELNPYSLISALSDKTKAINEEFSNAIGKVASYLSKDIEFVKDKIGTSGYVLKSVPFAFYCFLKRPNNFGKSVLNAVNSGGDTDTNASITGALSGCYNGTKNIPSNWIGDLKEKEIIETIARKLFDHYLFNLPSLENRRISIYRAS